MNQGLVDKDGHWHPIFSTGSDGIDDRGWYERKIKDLKLELGYDLRPADIQHSEKEWKAVKEVFGDEWYLMENVDHQDDPRVRKLMEKEDERYGKFIKAKVEYGVERAKRLDHAFMLALERELESDRPSDVGLLDDEHIKETCRMFCNGYEGNVGMMTNCLDKMAEMGYDVWCTCSDCGKQFQCRDYGRFSFSIDNGAYTGDGGVGVIMKRVLCDDCRSEAECQNCLEMNRPNGRRKDGREWNSYDFLSCLIYDWIGVCCYCTYGYERDVLERWEDGVRKLSDLGERYYDLEEKLICEDQYDVDVHKIYDKLKGTRTGRKKINEMRDLLQDSVQSYFNSLDAVFDDRLDEEMGQMKIPEIE